MPYLLIFAAIRLEQWKLPRSLRESTDQGWTEIEGGPDRRVRPDLERLAPWELSRAGPDPWDRHHTIGTSSKAHVPMPSRTNNVGDTRTPGPAQ